eukprot:4732489-Pyramimonas_sp.AAC.1
MGDAAWKASKGAGECVGVAALRVASVLAALGGVLADGSSRVGLGSAGAPGASRAWRRRLRRGVASGRLR